MPCPGLTCIGYLLAIPTLGLSWVLMWLCCVRTAEKHARKAIDKCNGVYAKRGVEVGLVVGKGTSWLEFKLI